MLSDGTDAFPGDSLKHTCPFSPTYLIAVGTLINSRCCLSPPASRPFSADELGQTAAHASALRAKGTGIRDLYEFGPQFNKD